MSKRTRQVSFLGLSIDPVERFAQCVAIAGYLASHDKARYDAWLCLHAPRSTGENYSARFARKLLTGGIPRRHPDLSSRRDRFRPRIPWEEEAA